MIVQRRSLYWTKDLNSGSLINDDCIASLRPCPKNAIGANEYANLLGKRVKKDVKSGDMIKKEEVYLS